jgi:hypothetical protein
MYNLLFLRRRLPKNLLKLIAQHANWFAIVNIDDIITVSNTKTVFLKY